MLAPLEFLHDFIEHGHGRSLFCSWMACAARETPRDDGATWRDGKEVCFLCHSRAWLAQANRRAGMTQSSTRRTGRWAAVRDFGPGARGTGNGETLRTAEKQNACISGLTQASCGEAIARLLTQTQLLDQRAVTVGILALQVVEQLAAAAHHAQQAAAAVVILRVGLEVTRQFDDTRGQQRDLDFGRTRVVGAARELSNDIRLLDICNRHVISFLAEQADTEEWPCREGCRD